LIHTARQGAHGVVGTTPGAEAIRALEKVLLVDGLQHLAYSILDHFVLERRNPNRPCLALGLRDVHPSDRLVAVPLRLQPCMPVLKVGLQGMPILLLRDAIHSYRRLGTLAAIGSPQGWHLAPMCHRVEPSCGFALRSLHSLHTSW